LVAVVSLTRRRVTLRAFFARDRRRRPPRTGDNADAVRSEASEFRREERRECVQVRGIKSDATGRLLAGNIND